MADTLVEKNTCDACGADVRSGSLFCYNCGGAVSLDLHEEPKSAVQVSDAWLKSDLGADSDFKTTRLDAKSFETSDLEKADRKNATPVETDPLLPIEKPSKDEPNAKLKSAASMRRKAKTYQRKSTEVVWEEPEGGPNKWFPLVALFLILLVVGIYYAAMYLR